MAKNLGLRLLGTIGVLMESLKKGYTQKEEIQEYVEIFRMSHRRISETLLKQLLELSERIG